MSGRNTSVSKSRLGCRLPCENPDAGDGYAASGEVAVYRLTPEEVAKRYGPPVPRRTDNFIPAGKIVEAVSACDTPEEAAEMLGISVKRLKWEIGSWGIKAEYGVENRTGKEVDEMATRLEQLRLKLSMEQYLALKKDGLNDREVLKRIGFPPIWAPVLSALKDEWGVRVITNQHVSLANAPEKDGKFGTSTEDQGVNMILSSECYPQATEENKNPEVKWYSPVKVKVLAPTARVVPTGVIVNTQAKDIFGRHVKIGYLPGKLVLMPASEGKGVYILDSAGKTKSKVLVEALKADGVQDGKYILRENKSQGWWEADLSERID